MSYKTQDRRTRAEDWNASKAALNHSRLFSTMPSFHGSLLLSPNSKIYSSNFMSYKPQDIRTRAAGWNVSKAALNMQQIFLQCYLNLIVLCLSLQILKIYSDIFMSSQKPQIETGGAVTKHLTSNLNHFHHSIIYALVS